MKKSILGSFVGLAIVISLDSFSRVVISLYEQTEIMMIAYSSYGGILWPILLTLIAGFSAFFGGMFGLTYGRDHKKTTGIFFITLLIGLRYGQVHLLIGYETLFYPIAALVLSLFGTALAWKLISKPQKTVQTPASKQSDQKHHHPVDDEP